MTEDELLSGPLGALDAVVEALSSRTRFPDSVERILGAVRQHLGMDVAMVGELSGDDRIYHWGEGHGGSFGVRPGDRNSRLETLSETIASEAVPHFASDTRDLRATDEASAIRAAGIRSYAGAPIRLRDGSLYGTLCAFSHRPRPDLDLNQVRFLQVVGQLIADLIERRASVVTALARGRIRRLLEGPYLRVALQPIIAVPTGRPAGFEALARFGFNPTREPLFWLEEAETAGLRQELEVAAARAAMARLSELPEDAYLAINVSPDVVGTGEFGEVVAEAPDRVVAELTEHARVPDYEVLSASLADLREAGLRVAVDDAGAGFATLAHVLHLRPDLIKLDMAITRGIDADPLRRSLAVALVAFATEAGAEVVAEGVSTVEEFDALVSVGVGYVQGFHLAEPSEDPIAMERRL